MNYREKAMMIVEVMEMLEKGSSTEECLCRLFEFKEKQTKPKEDKSVSKVENAAVPQNAVHMLTVKECMEVVGGIKEHTLRQLLLQKKIPSIRCGEGRRGKFLVRREDLISYFENLGKSA